jgi:hypothetical protein
VQRLKPDVDIVLDVLEAVLRAQPDSSFTQSIYRQYRERGGLSKKQLEGLFGKAQKIPAIPANKLATLEAIIKRKPLKEKSVLPNASPLYEKDTLAGELIEKILKKFPQHKRVIFFRSKYTNNETLSSSEMTELKKFAKMIS